MATSNFINECKKGANCNRLGKIIVDGVQTPIDQSNKLVSFSIDSGCFVNDTIVGTVYIKCLTGQLIGIDSISNLLDKEIQAQIGVKYANSTTEYIEMGKYTIQHPKPEKTAKKCKIEAYDNIYNNLNEKYISNIDYSTEKTVADLYSDVCSNLNLTPVTTTFLNSDIPISNNPFTNGETNKTVLESIAKVACSFVTIDETTDKIDLSWLSNSTTPDYTFQTSDYSTLEGGEIQYGPINVVIVKQSQIDDENVTMQDDESIELYGEHKIIISEDYILYNEELRQQAIEGIFERLDGLKYIDSKITCYYGKPFLKIGDKIRIYLDSTNYIDTYVLKHNFTYDGAFTSIIESPALTEQEIKTKQDISLRQALRNTEIIVNKQSGEISSITSKVQTIDTRENNNYREIINKFDGYAPINDVVQLERSVETIQTNTYTKTEVNEKLIDGSVTKVSTTSGTFDESGLTIEKTDAKTKGRFNEVGMTVTDATGSSNTELLFAGYDEDLNETVVRTKNINVSKYLTIGTHSRIEDYEDGAGIFYVG